MKNIEALLESAQNHNKELEQHIEQQQLAKAQVDFKLTHTESLLQQSRAEIDSLRQKDRNMRKAHRKEVDNLRQQLRTAQDTTRTLENRLHQIITDKQLESSYNHLEDEIQRKDKNLQETQALCESITGELRKAEESMQIQSKEFYDRSNDFSMQIDNLKATIFALQSENQQLRTSTTMPDYYPRSDRIEPIRSSTPILEQKAPDKSHLQYKLLHPTPQNQFSPLRQKATNTRESWAANPEEEKIREDLYELKKERAFIRGEIENRIRRLDDRLVWRSRENTPSPITQISARMNALEARISAKLR